MIKSIPQNQLCQVFDPIMIFPEKTKYIIDDPMKANTSCVAPAYVYMEGSRGKRFLCDYHYFFEKDTVKWRTPEQWNDISLYLIDNTEDVKKTFLDNSSNVISQGTLCWCKKQAYVMTVSKVGKNVLYFCNFHFRKTFYRYLSNGVNFADLHEITDERYKIKFSINEEAENLTLI